MADSTARRIGLARGLCSLCAYDRRDGPLQAEIKWSDRDQKRPRAG